MHFSADDANAVATSDDIERLRKSVDQNDFHDDASATALVSRLNVLKKELTKECKVKDGLDRVLAAHATNTNKNVHQMVQNRSGFLTEDTRAKIATLRMQIDRIELALNGDQGEQTSERASGRQNASLLFLADHHLLNSTDVRTQDLMYRLYKEVALADGARNLIRTLKEMKKADPKTAKEVCTFERKPFVANLIIICIISGNRKSTSVGGKSSSNKIGVTKIRVRF